MMSLRDKACCVRSCIPVSMTTYGIVPVSWIANLGIVSGGDRVNRPDDSRTVLIKRRPCKRVDILRVVRVIYRK